MPFCKECGREIPDDSKFCQFCGVKLDARYTHHVPTEDAQSSPQVQKLPDEVVVKEGTLKGDPNLVTVLIMVIGFIAILVEAIWLAPDTIEQGDYLTLVLVIFVIALLFFGSNWIYWRMTERLSRLKIDDKGVHVSSMPLYGGLRRTKEYTIPVDQIKSVQKTTRVDDKRMPDGMTTRAELTNNMVIYLNDGRIKSFVRRDPYEIFQAQQILVSKCHVADQDQISKKPISDIYGTHINSKSWKDDWWLFLMILVFVIAPMIWLLSIVIGNILFDGARAIDWFLTLFVSVMMVPFFYGIYMTYSQTSVRSVDIKKEGLVLNFRNRARTINWSEIYRIDLAKGENFDQSKKMLSVLSLDKRRYYKLDLAIGQRIVAAFKENSGKAPPMAQETIGSRSQALSADRKLIEQIRPDLVKREKSVQAWFMIVALLFLFNLILLNSVFIMLLGVIGLGCLLIIRKRLSREKEEAIWTYRRQNQQ